MASKSTAKATRTKASTPSTRKSVSEKVPRAIRAGRARTAELVDAAEPPAKPERARVRESDVDASCGGFEAAGEELQLEREAAAVARTEGQKLLMAVPGSLQTIGEAIGATKQAVALWRTGARLPEDRWRRALSARFAIPVDAWDRLPGSAPAVEWFPSTEREPSALDDVNRLLALLRTQLNRTDLIGRERVQLGDSFSRALAQKERLERARETLENRVVREHPAWKRLKGLVIDALLPFPEAAQAVEAAILRALGEETST